MVAKTIELPNVKRMFLPDPGYFICDSDLAQADAQVVAWDANDEPLMEFFTAAKTDESLDLHGQNASDIFGGPPTKDNPNRKQAKAGVHAVNYAVRANTLATALGVTVHEADRFINRWFDMHPAIKDWHRKVESDMKTQRCITNKFGNRKIFFNRTDGPTALSEALAWIPQSTVALVINRAWKALDALDQREVQVLLQVHDSLVYQIKALTFRHQLPAIEKCFDVPIPYPTPLVIPAGFSYSAKSWGECKDADWQGRYI